MLFIFSHFSTCLVMNLYNYMNNVTQHWEFRLIIAHVTDKHEMQENYSGLLIRYHSLAQNSVLATLLYLTGDIEKKTWSWKYDVARNTTLQGCKLLPVTGHCSIKLDVLSTQIV